MRLFLTLLVFLAASPALAFDRVSDRAAFLNLVAGKELRTLGIRLVVTRAGEITGRAFGQPVTGSWDWKDGYFCRTLQAGDDVYGLNCQVVSQKNNRVRFQADRGTGDVATLRIK